MSELAAFVSIIGITIGALYCYHRWIILPLHQVHPEVVRLEKLKQETIELIAELANAVQSTHVPDSTEYNASFANKDDSADNDVNDSDVDEIIASARERATSLRSSMENEAGGLRGIYKSANLEP